MVSAGRRIKPEKGREWRACALSRGLVKEDDVRTESCMTQVGRTRRHRRGHPAGVRGAFTGEATGGLGRGGRGGPGARRAWMFLKAMMKNWDGPYEGHEADNISSLALFYEDRSPLSQRAWTLRCRARRDPE